MREMFCYASIDHPPKCVWPAPNHHLPPIITHHLLSSLPTSYHHIPHPLSLRVGVRIVNCARGGIIDESALLRMLESGEY